MENKRNSYKPKPGRKTVLDGATNHLALRLNDREYAKFLMRLEKSGLRTYWKMRRNIFSYSSSK